MPQTPPSRAAHPVADAPPEAALPDVGTLSFEDALKHLEGIVSRLERGDVPLEESITMYERGEALKQRCEALLRQAEERVEKIRLQDGKPVGVEPFGG